jgi:2-amino-4-hydroxy-6-hydroxymethyldihydropteridine diphosphokinase
VIPDHRVYLALGSNVDSVRNYPEAVRLLRRLGDVVAVSPVYETEPVGMPGAERFLNGAVLLRTELEPAALKARLRAEVEQPLGRVRPPDGAWQSRTIDVDIAIWDGMVGEIEGRHVPDPDILRHLHVARPLADLAPDLVHPEAGRTLAQIAAELEAECAALPLARPDIILGS